MNKLISVALAVTLTCLFYCELAEGSYWSSRSPSKSSSSSSSYSKLWNQNTKELLAKMAAKYVASSGSSSKTNSVYSWNKSSQQSSSDSKSSSTSLSSLVRSVSILDAEWTGQCVKMDIASENYKRKEIQLPRCKAVRAITLEQQKSKTKCEFEKSFGFDGNKVFAQKGCRGNFRVCCEPSTDRGKCSGPFRYFAGQCLIAKRDEKYTYREAARQCASKGGRLLVADDFVGIASKLKNLREFRDGRFFVGGASIFASLKSSKLNEQAKDNADAQFALKLTEKFKASEDEVARHLRRFCREATIDDWNRKTSISSRCISMDFDEENGPALTDCDRRSGYICQYIEVNKPGEGRWTPWISQNGNPRTGETEYFSKISKAALRGNLKGHKKIKLCRRPIGMQCREIGTNKLYTKENQHGLKLDAPCVNNRIVCWNKRQSNGKKCPDFEVRYQCPDDGLDVCAMESMRKGCEKRNKECKDTPMGAQCIKRKRNRSGREKIGAGTCMVENVKYDTHECASRGDPHYKTFDGTKYDFQGQCSYTLAATCQNYKASTKLPAFSIISSNEKTNPKDRVTRTRAFTFTTGGIRYTFTRGKLFVNGMERKQSDYRDDKIKVSAKRKGSALKLTITTEFCVTIRWDNKYGLYVAVPTAYRRHMCGLCGNFDGNPDNDMILPNSNKKVKGKDIGNYYQVANQGSEKCNDLILEPPPCSAEKIKEYSGPKYCGVFNVDGNSPFVAAVNEGANGDALEANKNSLRTYFEECVNDHCWMAKFETGRCHEMEETIEKIRADLVLDKSTLDKSWRAFAGCEVSEETRCGDVPNMEYKASYLENCQNTCANRMAAELCADEETTQGCVCKSGFYLDSNLNCVEEEECEKSCTITTEDESFVIDDGESVVVEACRTIKKCIAGEVEENLMQPCSENADCVGGGTKCVCRPGYKGDGHSCEPDRSCRENFLPMGTKCAKLVLEKLDWHSAAINCGSDGAQLARYDTDDDKELEVFFKRVPELYLLASATSRKMYCRAGRTCNVPGNQLAISARVRDAKDKAKCDGKFSISDDRKKLVVTGNECKTNFIVETISPSKFSSPSAVVTWVAGNLDVLGPNKRNGRTPYQVDAPRLLDAATISSATGCFQASSNDDGAFIISPNPNCEEKLPSICEYDNTVDNSYDPLDFKGIKEKTDFEGAVEMCADLGRPLATIMNNEQLQKAKNILASMGRDGWLSLQWDNEAQAYSWENGGPLDFSNFKGNPEPNYKDKKLYCVSMDKRSGIWKTEKCGDNDMYPLCGPPSDNAPTAFTPYYPAKGIDTLAKLRQDLRKDGSQDYICEDPAVIECSAKLNSDGRWVTSDRQQGSTLTCTKQKMACKKGQEFDCDTFRARVLCPPNDNQCNELQELGSTPCDGGKSCFPLYNHYVCKCPRGTLFNPHSNMCKGFCGVCSLWGDPHITASNGDKYDFMGTCKYRFAGLCDQDAFGDGPYFDILTKNKACGKKGKGASCVNKLEVKLFNIAVQRNGATIKQDFSFRVNVGARKYSLNGRAISQAEYIEKGAFTVNLKKGFFDLVVHDMGLSILLSGTKLKANIPGQFRDKMCGLCGDCGATYFKAANGTEIDVPKRGKKLDKKIMAQLGTEFMVFDDEAEDQTCEIPPVSESEDDDCSKEMEEKVSAPNMCGYFMEENSAFKECFSRTDMTAESIFSDCLVDACLVEDQMEAVCIMAKAAAGECLQKANIRVDWRRPDFCPMDCGEKEYRVDASCEETCGQSLRSRSMCNEQPEEGCVCPEGKMRQGDECVEPKDCGCKIMLDGGRTSVNLAPGESMVMPGCKDKALCMVNEDGTSQEIREKLEFGPNVICGKSVPVELECAKGFVMNDDGVSCSRDPEGCIDGFDDVGGMCVKVPPETKIWRSAVEACNKEDGTLVLVDTEVKMESLKDVMAENGYDSLYISGRVRVTRGENDEPVFQPELRPKEQGKVEWANFDFHDSIKENIIVSDGIDMAKDVPRGGLLLSLVARLNEEQDAIIIVAVKSDTPSNFICEQRNVEEEETEWFGPCNTDDNMEDDGDQETRREMIMDPECEICPVPMDVRCDAVEGAKGTEEGVCRLAGNGVYYSCDQGADCVDKAVSTKCAKDADECATNRDDCPERTECINTPGSYICKCNKDFPMMVNGKCVAIDTCTMSGPNSNTDYDYTFQGFSGPQGIFDYDCKFRMTGLCPDANMEDLPDDFVFAAFSVVSPRSGNELEPKVFGLITRDDVNVMFTATPEDLSKGKIMLGGQATTLGFFDEKIQTRFNFLPPGTLVIQNSNNYFRATISFPTRIEIEYPKVVADKLCGLCQMQPDADGKVVLSDKEAEAIAFTGEPKCKPRAKEQEPEKEPEKEDKSTTPAPPVDPCDEKQKAFCASLNELCGVSVANCENEVCENGVESCEYMIKLGPVNCAQGDGLKAFLQQQDCGGLCGENMELQYASRPNQPTCQEPNRRPAESESSIADNAFACICDESYVLSGDSCVRREDCGCTMLGRYYPPGYVLRNEDCSIVYTCLENNNVDQAERPCGANTYCNTEMERGPTCMCEADMYGNPDSPQGCKEGEKSEDGSKTCFTYWRDDGVGEEKCVCNMGFVSNCDDCEDIDECQEGLHECDLSTEVCVNEPGGYKCACAPGYEKDANGACKDKDECAEDSNVCGKSGQCVNSVGSYDCVCCTGYFKLGKNCVRDKDAFPDLPADSKCCAVCDDEALCQESRESPIPYCYTSQDGQKRQFPTYERLYQELCLMNINADPSRLSRGSCPSSGGPNPPAENPGEEEENPKPTSCDDDKLCDSVPPPPAALAEGEVCGPSSSPETFPSYCDMVRAVCKAEGGPEKLPNSPISAAAGPCTGNGQPSGEPEEEKESEPLFTPWSKFGPCEFKEGECGEGTQVRDRNVAPYPDGRKVREVEAFETKESRICFKPCEIDPENPQECPELSICDDVDPVCGSFGLGPGMTFKSECELNVAACKQQVVPVKLYAGQCSDDDSSANRRFCESGPKHETVTYNKVEKGIRCVGSPVEIGNCGNMLCEGATSNCCVPKKIEKMQVKLECHNESGDFVMDKEHIYNSATACECRDKDAAAAEAAAAGAD